MGFTYQKKRGWVQSFQSSFGCEGNWGHNIDFEKTFSPVIKLRLVLGIIITEFVNKAVSNAFLHGDQ